MHLSNLLINLKDINDAKERSTSSFISTIFINIEIAKSELTIWKRYNYNKNWDRILTDQVLITLIWLEKALEINPIKC